MYKSGLNCHNFVQSIGNNDFQQLVPTVNWCLRELYLLRDKVMPSKASKNKYGIEVQKTGNPSQEDYSGKPIYGFGNHDFIMLQYYN